MRHVRAITLAALAFVLVPTAAFADVTVFLGANTSPANRQVRGLAVGAGLLIVAFEFEYADTTDDPAATAPSLKTGLGNVLLQTPFAVLGIQPYFAAGGGLYQEDLGVRRDRGFAIGTGGGVKISLVGPIRLRVDYRLIKLGSGALTTPTHRVYAGLNVKF